MIELGSLVSGISNQADIGRSSIADMHRQTAELNRFQDVLTQAIESQEEQDRAAIRAAAEEFESFFIQMMFREMRNTTLNENSFIPRSNAEQIFTDMLDEEVARQSASSGGIGIADMIYRQMTKNFSARVVDEV